MKRLLAVMICLIFVLSIVDIAMAAPKKGTGYLKKEFSGVGPSEDGLTGLARTLQVLAENPGKAKGIIVIVGGSTFYADGRVATVLNLDPLWNGANGLNEVWTYQDSGVCEPQVTYVIPGSEPQETYTATAWQVLSRKDGGLRCEYGIQGYPADEGNSFTEMRIEINPDGTCDSRLYKTPYDEHGGNWCILLEYDYVDGVSEDLFEISNLYYEPAST